MAGFKDISAIVVGGAIALGILAGGVAWQAQRPGHPGQVLDAAIATAAGARGYDIVPLEPGLGPERVQSGQWVARAAEMAAERRRQAEARQRRLDLSRPPAARY